MIIKKREGKKRNNDLQRGKIMMKVKRHDCLFFGEENITKGKRTVGCTDNYRSGFQEEQEEKDIQEVGGR